MREREREGVDKSGEEGRVCRLAGVEVVE